MKATEFMAGFSSNSGTRNPHVVVDWHSALRRQEEKLNKLLARIEGLKATAEDEAEVLAKLRAEIAAAGAR